MTMRRMRQLNDSVNHLHEHLHGVEHEHGELPHYDEHWRDHHADEPNHGMPTDETETEETSQG